MADQAANDVDLVVANDPAIRGTIRAASPTTRQIVYSNASNIYGNWEGNTFASGGLLVSWLNYADAFAPVGENRESGFFHCDMATLNANGTNGCQYSVSGQSTVPVAWFWQVKTGPSTGAGTWTDYTAKAHTANPVVFGASGNSLYIGHTDKFRQAIISVSTAAAAGWTFAWQYWNGTAWAPLSASPANPFTTTGADKVVAFDPPADWKTTAIAGADDKFFYIRAATTSVSASAPPQATKIMSEDFVATSGTLVTVPAFDATVDANADGYLDATEYANPARAAGKTARLLWWSRMFSSYGQMRYATNPSSWGYRVWSSWYHRHFLPTQINADGIFMDNSLSTDPYPNWPKPGVAAPFATRECAVPCTGASCVCTTYPTDYGKLIEKVNQEYQVSAFTVMNTSNFTTGPNTALAQVAKGFTYEEFAFRPLQHMANSYKDSLVPVLGRATVSPRPHVIHDVYVGGPPPDPTTKTVDAYCKTCTTAPCPAVCPSSYPAGFGNISDDRSKLAILAGYYTFQDPEYSFLDVDGGHFPATSWQNHFIPASRYDIGLPDVAQTTWLTDALNDSATNSAVVVGNDPSIYNMFDDGCGTGATPAKYRLYRRTYTNGATKVQVLFKSRSYHPNCGGVNGDGKQTHVGPTTATTYTWGSPLPSTCRRLKIDGTVDTTSISGTTGVSIENAEGVILVCP